MAQTSYPKRENTLIMLYSPAPGTFKSQLDNAPIEEPCTMISTGRAGAPAAGSFARRRYSASFTSPFLTVYSLLNEPCAPNVTFAVAARAVTDGIAAVAAASPNPDNTLRR